MNTVLNLNDIQQQISDLKSNFDESRDWAKFHDHNKKLQNLQKNLAEYILSTKNMSQEEKELPSTLLKTNFKKEDIEDMKHYVQLENNGGTFKTIKKGNTTYHSYLTLLLKSGCDDCTVKYLAQEAIAQA